MALTGKILVFWIGGRLWEVVPYRARPFTRGSNCKALTGKVLVFWISLDRWSLIGGWLYMMVQL